MIFSNVIICFEKWGLRNQTMVYVRKSCLACPAAKLGNSICTCYPLCFKKWYELRPLPRGRNVPVDVYALSTPISVLFRVSVHTKQNQVLAVV
jgi:hypothetical protein